MKKVIFFIVLLFCIIVSVKADAKVDINYEVIENAYSNRIVNNQVRSAQAMLLTYQNSPIYCIKYGYPISYDGYYKHYISNVEELTDLQKRDIELIMYYGYMYMDHTSIYYYMATQELIWNILGEDIYWTTEDKGKGEIIDLTEYKNEIFELYNAHFIRPNFDLTDINFEVGKEVILEDTNNVLKDYFLMYSGNNEIIKDGNKLILRLYNVGYDSVILIRNYGYYEESIVFKENGYQSLIKLGGISEHYKIVDFNVKETSMILSRIDSKSFNNIPSGDASLEGAVYNIYDEKYNLLDTVITDENGEAIVENIYLRNYIIKEISPSNGYMANDYSFTASITFGNTPQRVYIPAYVIRKDLKITNIYNENSVYSYDEGIIFEIYNKGNLIKTITTDKNGMCNTTLDYGTYIVKQVNTKEGFGKIDDFEVVVSEGEDNLEFTFITEKEVRDDEETNNEQEDEDTNDIEEEEMADENNNQDDEDDSEQVNDDSNDIDNEEEIDNNDEQSEEDDNKQENDYIDDISDEENFGNNEENNNIGENDYEKNEEDSNSNQHIIEKLPQLLENKTDCSVFILLILVLCIRKFCYS